MPENPQFFSTFRKQQKILIHQGFELTYLSFQDPVPRYALRQVKILLPPVSKL